LKTTITAPRPGNRASASAAPSGSPTSAGDQHRRQRDAQAQPDDLHQVGVTGGDQTEGGCERAVHRKSRNEDWNLRETQDKFNNVNPAK
jgi:hypothetical protein